MKSILGTILLAALAAWSAVQAQAPARIRANVVSFDGKAMLVRTAVGKEIRVVVNDATRIQYPKPIALGDIKPGDFVASAAMPGPDGKLVARELRVFLESQRGLGEGHRPMDGPPGQTMTNATVAKSVRAANGQELLVEYKGGAKTIVVPPGIPVVALQTGDRSYLRPGSQVNVTGTTGADGVVSATGITATGKDGTRPN